MKNAANTNKGKNNNTSKNTATQVQAGDTKKTAFDAYRAHCKTALEQGQLNGKTAYAIQRMLMDNKPVTADQYAYYNQFVTAVKAAEQATQAVKGKISVCGIFNYLDGRDTGYKVASGLGNSVSLRTFLTNLDELAQRNTQPTIAPAAEQA